VKRRQFSGHGLAVDRRRHDGGQEGFRWAYKQPPEPARAALMDHYEKASNNSTLDRKVNAA
jgi:hypothetical protein